MANLKDVSRLSGVSIATVSRVLNNRGYISDKTRKVVYDAMERLNYHPNELARSLTRKYSNVFGVITPSVEQPYFGKMLQSIEAYASTRDIKIFLCNSNHEARKELEYLRMLLNNKVDGIILTSRTKGIQDSMPHDYPFVAIDTVLDDEFPCISSDNARGGVLAARLLLDKGCERLAYIGGALSFNVMANWRGEAFLNHVREQGLSPIHMPTQEANFSRMDYYEAIEKLLTCNPIDGVFCSNDVIAAQTIQVALRLNKRVPEDIKVIGYDDVPISMLTTPTITTIHQPIDEMGKYAVETLINLRKGEVVPMRTVLPVRLIERQST